MDNKKPRTMIVNVFIEAGDSIEARFDKEAQTFSLKVIRDGKNVSARKIEQTIFYARPKKPKFLNKIEFRRSSEFTVNQNDLLKQYDHVWAIDTNKREIFGQMAHVSVVTVCSTDGLSKYFPVLAIIFGETENNPELYGWRKFIEFIQATKQYAQEHHYGLVVDSEFSKISKFNERSSSIHGSFYLPVNWDLIYATSDSGKEYIFNKILAESDKVSSTVLDLISGKQSNAKHWNPIVDEKKYQPSFLPIWSE